MRALWRSAIFLVSDRVTVNPMRKLWAVTAVIIGLVSFAAPAGAATKHTITGTLTVNADGGWFASQTACRGVGGYKDIQPGTDVTVRNAKGKIIAVGAVALGTVDKFSVSGQFADTCVFPLQVRNVPDSDFYSIEIADRGAKTYGRKQMNQMNWRLSLSLG